MSCETFMRGRRAPDAPLPRMEMQNLVLAVAQHARTCGLTVVRTRASRISMSLSNHIELKDARNRHWFLRISDHRGPKATGAQRPHFDLITRDGSTGAELAFGFIQRVARGEVAWTDNGRAPCRKGVRPR
jgi:hypothetical protein